MLQKLFELQFAPNPREVLPWMLDHGVDKTLLSYGVDAREGLAACREGVLGLTRWTAALRAAIEARSGHRPFLSSLRRAAFTDNGGLLLVPAGVDPAKPLDLQGDIFWWCDKDILTLPRPSPAMPAWCAASIRSMPALSRRPMPPRSMPEAVSAVR